MMFQGIWAVGGDTSVLEDDGEWRREHEKKRQTKEYNDRRW